MSKKENIKSLDEIKTKKVKTPDKLIYVGFEVTEYGNRKSYRMIYKDKDE